MTLSMSKKTSSRVGTMTAIALIIAGIAAVAGCGEFGSVHPPCPRMRPPAAVVQVRRAPLSNTLSIAGEFLPYQEVELHAKVAGYIRNINVDIGDHVHKGQVLAVLEIPELVAQVQAASAGVRHSQEEISRAQNDVSRAEADHAALHAGADAIEAGIGGASRPDRGARARRCDRQRSFG